MKRLVPLMLLIALELLNAACSRSPVIDRAPAAAGDGAGRLEAREPAATNSAPAAVPKRAANLELTAPSSIDSSPFIVRGRARTFENHVTIELLDESNRLIHTTYATAAGDLGNLNPFEKSVFLPRHPGGRLTIALVDHSAKDGSIRERVTKRVPFKVPESGIAIHLASEAAAGDCQATRKVLRKIPKTTSRLRAVVEAVMAGPTAAEKKTGLEAPFPAAASITGVNLKGDLAIVDFDASMRNVGGACRAQALRSVVERSLLELPNVKRVEIRAAGNAALALQP